LKRQSLRGKLSAGTELHAATAAANVSDMAAALIRPAAEHDIIEMITLLAEAGRPMPTPGQFTAVAAVYRELMGHETALALVAEKKGHVVGVLLGALRPRANWLTVHAGFMAGSYVGLVAAAASEVTTRLPGNPASFSPAVTAITSLVVIVVGASWLMRTLSQMVARVSEPRRVR